MGGRIGMAEAVVMLGLAEDPSREAIAQSIQRIPDATDLHQIDPDPQNHAAPAGRDPPAYPSMAWRISFTAFSRPTKTARLMME